MQPEKITQMEHGEDASVWVVFSVVDADPHYHTIDHGKSV